MIAHAEQFDSRILWLEGRNKYIGSSDAPAILGHGYAGESISTVWGEKVGTYKKTFSPEQIQLMNEGRIGEQFVVAMFANRHPDLKVEKPAAFQLEVCPEHPYLCASLDAWAFALEERIPIEAKVIQNQPQEWNDGGCPIKYQIQLQHQMLVIGAKRGVVVAYVLGRYEERWYERDDQFLEAALTCYQKFWQHVIDRTPPQDDTPMAYAVQRAETEWGTARRLGKRGSDAVREYFKALEELDKVERKVNTAKALLAEHAKGVEFLILDDQQVVKMGKNTVKKAARLPRGVKIV